MRDFLMLALVGLCILAFAFLSILVLIAGIKTGAWLFNIPL